jgi:hypothetical protein
MSAVTNKPVVCTEKQRIKKQNYMLNGYIVQSFRQLVITQTRGNCGEFCFKLEAQYATIDTDPNLKWCQR